MSMDQAIIKMAQRYPGSNNYPLCIGDGQFGSRNRKGKDSGSPRYISVNLNKELADVLFLRGDLDILTKTYEDGIEVEPQYYMPVLPMCILETKKAVSYGWQHKRYARDLHAVVKLLKKLIKGSTITEEEKIIPPSTYGYKGDIIWNDGAVYAKGIYKNYPKQNKIIVTELPLFINPSKYVDAMGESLLVTNIRNYSTDANIEIQIDMISGYMDKIKDLDEFLHINQRFSEELNYINELGVIQHFDSIYEVLYKTFTMNKNKYCERARRESLLLKYLIMREENTLTFLRSIQNDKSTITKFYMEEEDVMDKFL
jgi:DNA topoisomerase-2